MESIEDHSLFDCIHFQDPLTFVPPLPSDALVPLPESLDDYNLFNDPFQYIHLPFSHVEEICNFNELPFLCSWDYADMDSIDSLPLNTTTTTTTTTSSSLFPCYESSYMGNASYNEVKDEKKVEEGLVVVKNKNVGGGGRSTKLSDMGLEEMRSYFYMPITRAAKEMNVGVTLLKKRCRELGIPRWPHRKMKSLKTLIHNVQELGKGSADEQTVRRALESLENHRKLMEESPDLQLTERTKKLRQACFKANYKIKRRALMQHPYFI